MKICLDVPDDAISGTVTVEFQRNGAAGLLLFITGEAACAPVCTWERWTEKTTQEAPGEPARA